MAELVFADKRYLVDSKDVTGVLTLFGGLKCVEHTDELGQTGSRRYSLLGDAVAKAFPRAVTTNSVGMYYIDYGQLVPVMVAALAEVNGASEAMQSQLAAMQEQINGLLATVRDLQTAGTARDKKIKAVEDKNTVQDASIAANTAQVAKNKAKSEANETQITANKAQIAKNKAKSEANEAQVAKNKAKSEANEAGIAALKAKNTEQDTAIAANTAKNTAQDEAIADARTTVGANTKRIQATEDKNKAQDTKDTEIEARLTALETAANGGSTTK